MSDNKVQALTVVLKDDLEQGSDELEQLIQIIRYLHGVEAVELNVTDVNSYVARTRVTDIVGETVVVTLRQVLTKFRIANLQLMPPVAALGMQVTEPTNED